MIDWNRITARDNVLIKKIAERAIDMSYELDIEIDRQTALMDLSAVHLKTPLRLQELSKSDNFNFAHDVFGIFKNINRKTGELDNHFSPRFTAR